MLCSNGKRSRQCGSGDPDAFSMAAVNRARGDESKCRCTKQDFGQMGGRKNGLPTNGVWGFAPAVGRQVAVGVWGYAGLGTRQPAAVTEGMKQFNQILRPKRAPGGEIFARSASRLTIFPVSNSPPLSRLRPGPPPSLRSPCGDETTPRGLAISKAFSRYGRMGRPAVALQSERV